MLFAEHEGKRLGDLARKIELKTSDPRFVEVGRLQRELLNREGRPFFYGWQLKRTYSAMELARATILQLYIDPVFEPAGEECGTKYDERTACNLCGAGAQQIGPLIIDDRRIPKGRDFAKTIAGEVVVSTRVADWLAEHGATADTQPVETRTGTSDAWRQLAVRSTTTDVVSPTQAGIDPFDDDPRGLHRCPNGHLLGLSLLSEVWVAGHTIPELDLFASAQHYGVRRGLLRPQHVLFAKPKLWRFVEENRLKGCRFEVVHVRA